MRKSSGPARRQLLRWVLAGAQLPWVAHEALAQPNQTGKKVTFPYPITRVPGHQALQKLAELQKTRPGVSVMLGSESRLEDLVEKMSYHRAPPQEWLARAQKVDVRKWFAHMREERGEYQAPEGENLMRMIMGDKYVEPQWPKSPAEASQEPTSHRQLLRDEPHEAVLLTTVPASANWQVPCYLKFGGWNSAPAPHEMAAICKYWHERHGAQVVCVTDDVMEMTVSRPPQTRDAARALAREHYWFCPDIVEQGAGDMEALAKSLLYAGAWYFWWD